MVFNVKSLLTHSNSFSFEMEKNTAGCRALNLNFIVGGVYFKNAECTAKHGAYTVKAVDTTGAGDTFTGYFLAGVEKGWGIHDILKRASIASAIAVSRAGAAASIPTLKEVLASKFIPE